MQVKWKLFIFLRSASFLVSHDLKHEITFLISLDPPDFDNQDWFMFLLFS